MRQAHEAGLRRRQDVGDEHADDTRAQASQLGTEDQARDGAAAAERHEDPIRLRHRPAATCSRNSKRGVHVSERAKR